jgi:hypothetical protein
MNTGNGLLGESIEVEAVAKETAKQPSKLMKLREFWEKPGDDTETKAFIEEYGLVDMFVDMAYLCPGVKVFLMPGFYNANLGESRLLEIARQQVKLGDYKGSIFVFRNRSRTALRELRIGGELAPLLKYYCEDRSVFFIDPEWTEDETAVKILSGEEYKVLLDRMAVPKKI